MDNQKGIYRALGSAALLITLASTVAYVFSQENIFRPPVSRSRVAVGSKLAEKRTESLYDSADRENSGRLQVGELVYLMK